MLTEGGSRPSLGKTEKRMPNRYAPDLRYVCNIFNCSIIYNNFNYKMSRFVDYTVEDAADFLTFELESGAESEDLLKNLVR